MNDFVFQSPTKIYFGKNKEKEIGKIIKEYGYKNVLLVYGQNSIKKSGLYQTVIDSLAEENINCVELSGVRPNPIIDLVIEGVALARKEKIDLILAVGGGSVIDTAKSIAHGYFYEGNPFDFNLKKAVSDRALPIGVILTIAAAGSELSDSCVISDSKTKIKRGFNNSLSRPLFAIENPDLLLGLNKSQIAAGVVDIIAHTLERYFNSSEEDDFADYIAEGLMKCILSNGLKVYENINDYNARANMLICSSFSHNGLTSMGKASFMPVHQLEHELSGLDEDIPHGLGLAILIPAWMKVCYRKDLKKFEKFAKNVMMVNDDFDEEKVAYKGIIKLEDYFKKLGCKLTLKEFGINDQDIITMCNKLTNNGTKVFPSKIPLDFTLANEIYQKCKGE